MMLALALFSLLPGCKHAPPEQALRDTISKMQAAGESGDIDALLEPIAEDFSGEQGMPPGSRAPRRLRPWKG